MVAMSAYLAAVFLVHDARRVGETELERYFSLRAMAAAAVAGVLALVGLIVLRDEARALFDDLVSDALPLVIASGICGIAALVQLARSGPGSRPLAIGATAAIIWGWGVAQSPELLPGVLTIDQAAAPSATLVSLMVVFGAAALFVVPAMALLYTLHQKALLEEDAEH